MQIINGEKVKKNYVLNTAIINRGNAKTILAQSEQLNHYQKRINRQKQEEDNLLSRFKFLRNSTILILALMLLIIPLLGYVMYMNLRVKNKNKELHDKNQLVEAQKKNWLSRIARLRISPTRNYNFSPISPMKSVLLLH